MASGGTSLQEQLDMEEARRRERERQGKQPLLVVIFDGIKQTFTDVRPKVGRLCEDLRAKRACTSGQRASYAQLPSGSTSNASTRRGTGGRPDIVQSSSSA